MSAEPLREHPRKVNVDDDAPGAPAPEDGRPGWNGMDVRWLITRERGGARESVFGVTRFPPGSRHDVHRHEHAEEIEYLISGSGVARVGDDDVWMSAGDAVLVRRNEYHGFHNPSATETAVMAWCYAGAASLDEAGYATEDEDRRHGRASGA